MTGSYDICFSNIDCRGCNNYSPIAKVVSMVNYGSLSLSANDGSIIDLKIFLPSIGEKRMTLDKWI